MSRARIDCRQITERSQFEEAVRLQKTIWGFDDIELLPVRLFVVANKVGGHSFGAYDGDRMVGFCVAIPGIKPGGVSYLHSHMLGVLAGYRNLGIGRRLKLMQRDEALARGIKLMEWTFDPLELKNAFFNMERLGAIVRRYVENQYGTTSSPLHGGLPTDRCIAEWWMDSPRVRAIQAGRPLERRIEERVEIPANIAEIRAADSRLARAIQKAAGERLQSGFARGLAVIGFEFTEDKGCYLMGPYHED
ncbi:MAG: GNAT family N-acetyltransferase [Bryobacteraceae bacterium]